MVIGMIFVATPTVKTKVIATGRRRFWNKLAKQAGNEQGDDQSQHRTAKEDARVHQVSLGGRDALKQTGMSYLRALMRLPFGALRDALRLAVAWLIGLDLEMTDARRLSSWLAVFCESW
jgi:hypothetical protein